MTSKFKGEIKMCWTWCCPYSILILTAASQGAHFLHVIAGEIEDQTEYTPYPKPPSRVGNQTQVHLALKSMLLHAISRKSQARWLRVGHS